MDSRHIKKFCRAQSPQDKSLNYKIVCTNCLQGWHPASRGEGCESAGRKKGSTGGRTFRRPMYLQPPTTHAAKGLSLFASITTTSAAQTQQTDLDVDTSLSSETNKNKRAFFPFKLYGQAAVFLVLDLYKHSLSLIYWFYNDVCFGLQTSVCFPCVILDTMTSSAVSSNHSRPCSTTACVAFLNRPYISSTSLVKSVQ